MDFIRERDLQLRLIELDFQLGGNCEHIFVRREVPVGGCIPDVIIISFKENPQDSLKVTRWSYRHAYIIWLLRQGEDLEPQVIAERCYESLERIMPILRDLLKNGVLERSNDFLTLSEQISSIKAEVTAIEAKLYRWRDALRQAETYKRFAHRVFVAMGHAGVPRDEDVLAKFRELEVGLCAVAENEVEWLVSPGQAKGALGPEQEYLVTSAAIPARQTLWSRRNPRNASNQA